jgi:signal transduction histidine kinase
MSRLSLRWQLILASFLWVGLSVGTIGYLAESTLRDAMGDQLKQRGIMVARHLAGISGDFLLAKERLALANFTSGMLNNKDVVYAQIVDAKGYVVAASPLQGVEGLYAAPAGLENLKDQDALVQRFFSEHDHQWIQDVAVNVMVDGQRAGSVHIGMTEDAVEAATEDNRQKILIALGAVLGLALLLSLLLSMVVARPLERLSVAVKSLGQGALETRVRSGGPQEIQRLEERFNAMAAKVESLVHGVIQSLARALGEHDQVSPGHAERVARYAARTGKHLKLGHPELEDLRLAAQLIDIGHMGLPAGLLHKSDPLSDEELRKLRSHPQVGARIIEPISVLKSVVPLLMHHHERFDGRGYPLGLKAEAIPLGARILAVCDSYDAMLTEKRHRRARTQNDAVRELQRCAGAQFDPKVVQAFVAQLSLAS